jgi:spermidine/putrescine transport system permease protein
MLWLTQFFIVPLYKLFLTSTETPSGGIGEFVQTYRWANFFDAISASKMQFIRSFEYAFIATALALIISYPLAYAIAFKSGKWKNVLLVLVVAPFFTSFLLRTIAWTQILGEQGFVIKFLRTLHIIGPTTHLTASAFAVVMGITYNFLPFMTLPLYSSLERIDPRTLEASGDLYANAFTTFRKVTLPLSMPGVVAGTLLTFIPAAGDYVNAEILGNPGTKMIGNVISARYLQIVDYPGAAALSFILMLTILIMVIAYIRKSGTEELV